MSKEEYLKKRQERKKKEEKEQQDAAQKRQEEARRAEQERQAKVIEEQAKRIAAAEKLAQSQAAASEQTDGAPPPPPLASGELPPPPPPVNRELPPLPMLTDDTAEWEEGDFIIARVGNDLRLPGALAAYGRRTAGRVEAAETLARVIQPRFLGKQIDQAEEAENGGVARLQVLLIDAAASALGVNGTARARTFLAQMVMGKLKTEHPPTAVMCALKSLASNPSPENEDLLFQVAVNPNSFRAADQGEPGPPAVRQATLDILRDRATSRFRLKLANYLVGPTAAEADRDLLMTLLWDKRPESFEGQIVLCYNPATDAAARQHLESLITQYSSDCVDHVLGLPQRQSLAAVVPVSVRANGDGSEEEAPPRPAPPVVAAPRRSAEESRQWASRVASQIWVPQFGEMVKDRLEILAAMRDGAPVIALGSTIPTDTMRLSLYKCLKKLRDEGPAPLREAGVADRLSSDPGLLTILKILQRLSLTPEGTQANKFFAAPGGKGSAALEDHKKRRQQLEQAKKDWEAFIGDLLTSHLSRCRTAGDAAADTLRRNGKPMRVVEPPPDLPIPLHNNDHILAAHYVDWTREEPKILDGVPADPCRVHYVRMEEKTKPLNMLGYYRRQLKDCELHKITNGAWLDQLSAGSQYGSKRSIDVRITTVDTSRPGDVEQKVIIELLSVEIRDPTGG